MQTEDFKKKSGIVDKNGVEFTEGDLVSGHEMECLNECGHVCRLKYRVKYVVHQPSGFSGFALYKIVNGEEKPDALNIHPDYEVIKE